MAAVLSERGSITAAKRPVRVAIISGMLDKVPDLRRCAQPLVDAGHEIEIFDSKWFSQESGKKKLGRTEDFLDEFQPEAAYGPSAGGLLLVVAGFEKKYLHRTSTAASPIHKPRGKENTPKLKAITLVRPQIAFLRNEYFRRGIHQRIGDAHQQYLHVVGSEDEIVPTYLSRMEGFREGMYHVRHVLVETPARGIRQGWAHTHTTRGVYEQPFFLRFIAGEPLAA